MTAAGPSLAALAYAVLAILVLLASGLWTDRTYRRFDRLPGHYDLTGQATRLDPRRQVAWLVPGLLSLVIVLMIGIAVLVPSEMKRGDSTASLFLTPSILITAQALQLALLRRWARRQP